MDAEGTFWVPKLCWISQNFQVSVGAYRCFHGFVRQHCWQESFLVFLYFRVSQQRLCSSLRDVVLCDYFLVSAFLRLVIIQLNILNINHIGIIQGYLPLLQQAYEGVPVSPMYLLTGTRLKSRKKARSTFSILSLRNVYATDPTLQPVSKYAVLALSFLSTLSTG